MKKFNLIIFLIIFSICYFFACTGGEDKKIPQETENPNPGSTGTPQKLENIIESVYITENKAGKPLINSIQFEDNFNTQNKELILNIKFKNNKTEVRAIGALLRNEQGITNNKCGQYISLPTNGWQKNNTIWSTEFKIFNTNSSGYWGITEIVIFLAEQTIIYIIDENLDKNNYIIKPTIIKFPPDAIDHFEPVNKTFKISDLRLEKQILQISGNDNKEDIKATEISKIEADIKSFNGKIDFKLDIAAKDVYYLGVNVFHQNYIQTGIDYFYFNTPNQTLIYDNNKKVYTAQKTMYRNIPDGTWTIENFIIVDSHLNLREYFVNNINDNIYSYYDDDGVLKQSNLNIVKIEKTQPTSEILPPQLNNISFSVNKANAGEEVTISADVNDNGGSDIDSVSLSLAKLYVKSISQNNIKYYSQSKELTITLNKINPGQWGAKFIADFNNMLDAPFKDQSNQNIEELFLLKKVTIKDTSNNELFYSYKYTSSWKSDLPTDSICMHVYNPDNSALLPNHAYIEKEKPLNGVEYNGNVILFENN